MTEPLSETTTSAASDGSTDLPICGDELDDDTINRWFAYWEYQCTKKGSGRCVETIRKIRRLALAGAKKGRRNNAAVADVLADVLAGMAQDVRAGKIRIR